MKKVLMISRSQIPYDTRVIKEAQSLSGLGHKTTIFCIRRSTKEQKYQKLNSIFLERILFNYNGPLCYWYNHIGFIMHSFIRTLKASLKREFEIIHFHNPPDLLYICAIIPKLFGIKIVFDFHDPSPEFFKVKISKKQTLEKVNLFIEKKAIEISDRAIVTNETTKRLFEKRHQIGKDKITVVKYGINRLERGIYKNTKHKKSKTVQLIFIGNMAFQDNGLFLLDIAHYLLQKPKINFKINIIGTGSDFEIIKKQVVKQGLQKYFKLYGKITNRKRLFKILKNSDIGLEPSVKNDLNNIVSFIKLFEYSYFLKPSVCFKTKESEITLGGSGLLAKSQNQFLEFVEKLCVDKKKYKVLKKNALKNRKNLYWEKSEKELFNLYKSL